MSNQATLTEGVWMNRFHDTYRLYQELEELVSGILLEKRKKGEITTSEYRMKMREAGFDI